MRTYIQMIRDTFSGTRVKIQKLLATAATLFLMTGAAAYATTVTVDGNYTVSYTAIHGNGPTFTYTGDLNHSAFAETLTLNSGVQTSAVPFFTIDPNGSCGTGCVGDTEGTHHYYTASGTISVTFGFTNLTVLSSSSTLTETGLYQAKYGGNPLSPCAIASGSGDTDCITWTANASGGHNPLVVNFSNGDTLDIFLSDAEDWNITPKISFELLTTPTGGGGSNPTPIPAALPLFATGLGAFGLLGWRRKRKGAAIAAA
jgi:hypothetical protein